MNPVHIDIPHSTGTAAARQRIEGGFQKLAGFVPGGKVFENRGEGDSLFFAVEALGQRVAARLYVLDDKVHAEVDLPPALALFAGNLRGALADTGTKLLRQVLPTPADF